MLLLGATTNVALGKSLPLFLRLGRGWAGTHCPPGCHGGRTCSLFCAEDRLVLRGVWAGTGAGQPLPLHGARGALGTWGSPLLGPDPLGWWWLVAGAGEGKWSPVQGELIPPRNSSHALCNE